MAATIAGEIRRVDTSQGAVLGVLGPWGSGKTSLINLIRSELDEPPKIIVLDFNPWFFSGADQLVESFFVELAAQLRLAPGKLKSIADELATYGEIVAPLQVIPIVGSWVARLSGAAQVLKKLDEQRKTGVTENRKRLAIKLGELDAPIVVVVDDVDRLNTGEIRAVFKLVRLTANFPNLLYLVAFDRTRVENALSEEGLPGRDYLEKIIQIIYNIPSIPAEVLTRQTADAIDEALADIAKPGPFDTNRWPDSLVEVIDP